MATPSPDLLPSIGTTVEWLQQLDNYELSYGVMPPELLCGRQSPAYLALAYARSLGGVSGLCGHDEWSEWTSEEMEQAIWWLIGFFEDPGFFRFLEANGWPDGWAPPPIPQISGVEAEQHPECRCSG